MSSFQEGWEQGERIGNIFTLGFRIMWFFWRIAWWLSIFLIASIIAGIAALFRMFGSKPDPAAGFGTYSHDQAQWQDTASGQLYPVRKEQREICEVKAAMHGLHWQRNAMSRLIRRGAIFHYRFSAVSDGLPGEGPRTVASAEFLNEARHNITLDHLDPAQASVDPYDLSNNRDEAVEALKHLDWLLTNTGWTPTGELADHWYARTYERPVILWDQPVGAPSLSGG